MTPIELLQKELTELQRSLDKSYKMYNENQIPLENHQVHIRNLTPMITKYENAIKKLLE